MAEFSKRKDSFYICVHLKIVSILARVASLACESVLTSILLNFADDNDDVRARGGIRVAVEPIRVLLSGSFSPNRYSQSTSRCHSSLRVCISILLSPADGNDEGVRGGIGVVVEQFFHMHVFENRI